MATIDEELGTLERDIRQLKIEYDQYFGGGRKRPPTEIEWRIDQLVKRYAERGGELKFAQRFRFKQSFADVREIQRYFQEKNRAERRRKNSAALWRGGEGDRSSPRGETQRRAGRRSRGGRVQDLSHDVFRAGA